MKENVIYFFRRDNPWLWYGLGTLVLLGIGGVVYAKKQQAKKQRYDASAKGYVAPKGSTKVSGFECSSRSYPLGYGACHDDVAVLQRYLISFGKNLGSSGANGDGVDARFGKLTLSAAKEQLGKQYFTKDDIQSYQKALAFVGYFNV